LAYIFITPNTHQVHHHNKEPFTNTNYGDILSVWDHLFGTYQFVETHEELNFGLDSFPSKEETENFGDMLRIPFGKYRPKPE
jgi:sterol desaturase/sphingolipid hydroxylase (fatty acid hydroxylase superfamily)